MATTKNITKSKKTTKAKTKAATGGKKKSTAGRNGTKTPVMDRRSNSDRRKTTEKRRKNEPVAKERRTMQRRAKVNRRRQIDPTTCERDYTPEEIEFMSAMDDYKRTSGRMFPTCSEVLEVIKNLGYEKHSAAPPSEGTKQMAV